MSFDQLKRREFITLLGGGAAWPLAARAQQSAFRLGILTGRTRNEPNFAAFFHELQQFGIVEGQNFTVDPRGFEVPENRFPALANELIGSGVNVVLTAGDAAIRAAQAATRVTPILAISDDMVGAGLVRSLARPEGNLTGVSILSTELNRKRLDLLMEVFKDARRMALLSDPRITIPEHLDVLRDAARVNSVDLKVFEAGTPEEIAPAIDAASMGRRASVERARNSIV
jgi:putative tryptophan/tyrosine transport system substrate-binding protein